MVHQICLEGHTRNQQRVAAPGRETDGETPHLPVPPTQQRLNDKVRQRQRQDSPGCVGGRDEEVDDHAVDHVQAVLHHPGRQRGRSRPQAAGKGWGPCAQPRSAVPPPCKRAWAQAGSPPPVTTLLPQFPPLSVTRVEGINPRLLAILGAMWRGFGVPLK